MSLYIAIDGGNTKTDVLVGSDDGHVLARARGGPFRPQVTGVRQALDSLEEILAPLLKTYGRVEQFSAFLAGADLPEEEQALARACERRHWAHRVHVANDTFAVLAAGTSAGWGAAVVCGAGINCVARSPDGNVARYLAFGQLSGDWGGGNDLGHAALWHAARAEDGRGPHTMLATLVPAHFEIPTVREVILALHSHGLAENSLHGLTRPLFAAAADGDAIARNVINDQAREIAAMARGALKQLSWEGDRPVEIALGGGILASGSDYFTNCLLSAFAILPHALLRTVAGPPVAGAAMHALGELKAPESARERIRNALSLTIEERTPISPNLTAPN